MADRIQTLILATVILFILVLFAISARDEMGDNGYARRRVTSTYTDPAEVDEPNDGANEEDPALCNPTSEVCGESEAAGDSAELWPPPEDQPDEE